MFSTQLSAVEDKKDKRHIYYPQISHKLLGETRPPHIKQLTNALMRPGGIGFWDKCMA